jgi:hypothetical protein
VADILVTDDALGTNELSLSGTNAASFEIIGTELFLKSGTTLNYEALASLSITVSVDDTTVGATPDATVNYSLTVTDVNEAPTAVTLQNAISTLPENTSTTAAIKVADILVTDDALGTNELSLSGTDATSFEIVGTELFLKAGTTLNYEALASLSISVNVDDTTVGAIPDATVSYSLTVSDVNEAPTAVTLQNVISTLPENTNTTAAIKVADILVTDDALGTIELSLSGTDATSFEIVGTELFLKAGTTLNYEALASLSISVNVDDTTVGAIPDATVSYSLTVSDVNEAPTAVTLQNVISTLPENTNTTAAIKVADILVTDDALGTIELSLSGTDAASFEIIGTELFLKAGTTLNFEALASLSITVSVDDTTVGATPDATVSYSLTVSDVNEAPTAVTLQNVISTLPENTSTASAIKVADILVTDDALGTNDLSLSGTDAASFEIVGTELFLKAGTTLNFEALASLSITVSVDDTTVGATPDATVSYSLTVTDVNEAPTAVTLQNVISTLPEKHQHNGRD